MKARVGGVALGIIASVLMASSAQAQGAAAPKGKPAAKPADAKAADAPKPGDAKPGDAKPGDAKPGDAKPGDAKPGDKPEPATAEPKPAPEPAPATDDDDDDDGGLDDDDDDDGGLDDDEYHPPMAIADYSKPQLEGYVPPHHKHKWVFNNLTAVRLNPLGLTNRFRTGYHHQLSYSPEKIFQESYFRAMLDTEITPAYGYVGARVDIQPAKLFNFYASYGMLGTFGSFSVTRSFQSAGDEWDDPFLEDTRSTDDYASLGHKGEFSGLFQFGIGGIAMRNNVKAYYFSQELQGDDQVFYWPTLDVLIPNNGWVMTNDADLLVLTDFNLKFGLRYTFTQAFYRDEHLQGGENLNTPHHRVGPAFLYTFFEDKEGTQWNKPTLVVLAQWWAKHRYRTTLRPALPYLVIGFLQQGDLLVSAKK